MLRSFNLKNLKTLGLGLGLGLGATVSPASAADEVDWRQFEGETISLVMPNVPWTKAFLEILPEFIEKTGINVQKDVFAEEQYRARMNTVMSASASDIDGFMTLTIREGAMFNAAGWYADLKPLIENPSLTPADYDYEGFSPATRKADTIDGKVVAVPIAIEGPMFFWRKDLFAKCKIDEPMTLEELPVAAAKLKACDPQQGVWATRGLPQPIPYTLAGFIYNLGGQFTTPDGQPGLCQDKTVEGIALYAEMLKEYGLPGALTYGYEQVTQAVGQGMAAMALESSNVFAPIVAFPGRAEDLGVKALPKGRETGISKPVALSWGLSVSAHSKKKEATWLLWQWATSLESQRKLLKLGGAGARSAVFTGPEFETWTDELPIREQWARALEEISENGTGVFNIDTDRIPEARQIIGDAIQQIVLGEATPKEAACAADEKLAELQ